MTTKTYTTSIAALSNDADGICQSQTKSSGGTQSFTINGALASGGVATNAAAQIVTITSAGNDSGVTFTITGTDADGKAQSETVTGPNTTTANSVYYYKTVTAVSVSGDTAAGVTIGPVSSNGAVSPTIEVNLNEHGDDFKYLLHGYISGSTTQAVETCPDSPNDHVSVQKSGVWIADTTFTGKTASFQSLAVLPAKSVRLKLSSYTSGTAELTILERVPGNVK